MDGPKYPDFPEREPEEEKFSPSLWDDLTPPPEPMQVKKPEPEVSAPIPVEEEAYPVRSPLESKDPHYVPMVHTYTPAIYHSDLPSHSAEKRGVRPAAVIAIAVVCALLASLVTSACFVGANLWMDTRTENPDPTPDVSQVTGGGSGSGTGSSTTIVTETDSVVEAVTAKASASIVGIRVTSSQTYFFYGTQESQSEGSGIIYTADGYLITNYHVIESALTGKNASIEVFLNDGSEQTTTANVVGYEIASDLAVIKINGKNLAAAEMGSSAGLKLGQTAIAIGNPGGINYLGSVSAGIISGLNRTVSIDNIGDMTLIQTDAAINPGNSGGALLDASGKVIGVVSSKIVSEEYEGIGFAIPVDTAVQVVEKIIRNQGSQKPYSGLTISTSYDSATLNKMGYPSGVVVEQSNGPAATAGILRGDVITSFNGVQVTSYEEYTKAFEQCKPGQRVQVKLYRYRDRRNYTATITLGQTYN